MFRPRIPVAPGRRRAVILMVVLVLLTLFAIIGLAFVLYANSEAESSRIYREAATVLDNRPDLDVDSLANWSIGQFTFGIFDPGTPNVSLNSSGAYSAMRGHDLGRDLYGWNVDLPGSNIIPFNGTGHLHSTVSNPWGVDDHSLISYVFATGDPFMRDPERLGTRTGPSAAWGPYTGGWNSSYTYADGNHVFLGAVDADGNVLARSFYRPYLIPKSPANGQPYLPLDPNHPNYWSWFTDKNPNSNETVPPYLRYSCLRPRNKDMAPGFPIPGPGGDVRNLPGNGPFDSHWMDLDYPVQTAPDGTPFKPLFAIFATDLDGRVNLNAHGNVRGLNGTVPAHVSNQGWGKWEVNVGQVLSVNGGGGSPEWPQLFLGSAAAPTVPGRYGADQMPATAGNLAIPGKAPRVYGQVDFDASNDGQGGVLTAPFQYPESAYAPPPPPNPPPPTPYVSFPYFPPGFSNGSPAERKNHPLNYNTEYPGGDDRRFGAGNLVGLLNSGGGIAFVPVQNNVSPRNALNTDLGKLLPNNMSYFHIRNLITTDSAALDTAALTPWVYDRSGNVTPAGAGYTANVFGYGGGPSGTQGNPRLPPSGPAQAFPPTTTALRNAALPASTEFRVDWRSVDAALTKINLNRFLSPYPHMGQGTNPQTYQTTPLTTGPYDRFDDGGPIQTQFNQAQADRQQFADDIYRMLLKVTGVPPVPVVAGSNAAGPFSTSNPGPADLAPRRWLAQLAVNIVDFIDEDEISTPFNFYGQNDGLAAGNINDVNQSGSPAANNAELYKYWVYGTELPKVVINEVLAEYQTPAAAGTQFPVRVFAELFNPMPTATQVNNNPNNANYPTGVQQQDNPANPIPLYMQAAYGNAAYSPYAVVIADNNTADPLGLVVSSNPSPNNNDNVLGTPNVMRAAAPVSGEFANPVKIDDGTTAVPSVIAPQGFVLVGPTGGPDYGKTFAVQKAGTPGVVPTGTATVLSNNMQYNVTGGNATPWQINGSNVGDQTNGINVLLRRLANPHMPPSATNPYITVDYMRTGSLVTNDAAQAAAYSSTCKAQPYAADPTQYLNVKSLVGAAATPPAVYDTFGWPNTSPAGSTNAPGTPPPGLPVQPYNWLVHLDRQLISPMELLQVSGYHPHELTTQFMQPNASGGPYAHRVNWYNEAYRLYRAFEVLGTHDRAAGVSPLGGRRAGMININTMPGIEVFRALCDAQGSNGFNAGQVDQIYNQMVAMRSPLVANPPLVNGQPAPQISGQDRPFLGMGIGNLPTTDPQAAFDDGTAKPVNTGIEDTFLRSNGGGRLFDVPGAGHPYQQRELMTKIFSNVTNRSNVFAVWVTVGFFRVPDPNTATRPIPLAEEIGLASGTNIRHQFFTVIDRSRMTIANQQVTTLSAAPAGVNQPVQLSLGATSGTTGVTAGQATPIPWQIQAGSTLLINPGQPTEETIFVQPGPGGTLQTTFQYAHNAGEPVWITGNPGPQLGFLVNNSGFPKLILAYAVLQ